MLFERSSGENDKAMLVQQTLRPPPQVSSTVTLESTTSAALSFDSGITGERFSSSLQNAEGSGEETGSLFDWFLNDI